MSSRTGREMRGARSPLRRGAVRTAVGLVLIWGAGAAATPEPGAAAVRRARHPDPPDTVEFALFLAGVEVGREVVRVRRGPDGAVRESDLSLSARGQEVLLRTVLESARDGSPRRLGAAGRSFPWWPPPRPWSAGGAGGAPAFPVSSPLPVGMQRELVDFWRARGRPDSVAVPGGSRVEVAGCGVDTVWVAGSPRPLECYEVGGLGWGRSLIWLEGDSLAAASVPTIFGTLQALRPAYRPVREAFLRITAERGMQRLASRVRPLATSSGATVAIVGGTLVDPATGRTTPDGVVLVRDDRIVAVGAAPEVAIPWDATVLDARGSTVLPGLWDMHAHLKQVDWGPAYLGVGVTTVRDVGNDVESATALRRASDAGAPAPRILLAGFIDGASPSPHTSLQANTPEEGRRLVRRYHRAGFEQVKLWSNVPAAVVPAITAEAHRLGMSVTGHVPSGMTLSGALDAGLDQVNHLWPLLDALERGPDSLRTPDRLARHLRARGVVVEPTLVVEEFAWRSLDRPMSTYEPAAVRAPRDVAAAVLGLRQPPARAAEGVRRFGRALEVVRALHGAGVPLVAGSDQGIPGYTLLNEIELLVLAGLTPLDALRAATTVPARVMGLSGEVGMIAPGMRADLIIVPGDPLRDVRALRGVRWVVRAGRVYDTRELQRAAGFRD